MTRRPISSRKYYGPPASLQNAADNNFQLTVVCAACTRRGPTRTPAAWAALFGVPMTAAWNTLPQRMKCTACGARRAYFSIQNPRVPRMMDMGEDAPQPAPAEPGGAAPGRRCG